MMQIKGLPEAFETPGVCSNYSSKTVGKTLESLEKFKDGNAIFTFPNTPIKCAGAPQKIMYLADEYFKKVTQHFQNLLNNLERICFQHNKNGNVMFNSASAAIFAVKKYAEYLNKVNNLYKNKSFLIVL